VRISWTSGAIDLKESVVTVPSLGQKLKGVSDSTGRVNPGESSSYDLKSFEFRAPAGWQPNAA
jgi:hypothetical protein